MGPGSKAEDDNPILLGIQAQLQTLLSNQSKQDRNNTLSLSQIEELQFKMSKKDHVIHDLKMQIEEY